MKLRDFTRIVFGAAFASMGVGVCLAASAEVEILIHGDRPFPESITSTSNGALIIGGLAKGMVYRAAPGSSAAEPWIQPGTNGLQRVLGVLADEKAQTLWVCSVKQGQGEPTGLKAFDLKTGAAKGRFAFPGENSVCNDIAVGQDGTAYATDTGNARILRLKKGSSALEVWVKDELLGAIDGIAFGDSTNIYANTFTSGHLVRIPVRKDGAAGKVVQLQTSMPLTRPDGMRPIGKNVFLLIEGA